MDDPAGTPASKNISLSRLFGAMDPGLAGGRLTLETGVPVSTADQTGKTTLYYTPFLHDRLSVYDGTRWQGYLFTERSLALGTLTSGLPYDVFVYDNAGTLTLELLAWTSGTARATALVRQNGVWAQTGALTRRYLGTIYTTATTTTEDSRAKRFVWNAMNRVRRPLLRNETTANWTYNTASFQQARAQAANQVEVTIGLAEDAIDLWLLAYAKQSAGDIYSAAAIGEDSTTTPATDGQQGWMEGSGSARYLPCTAMLRKIPAVGYHKYTWLEYGGGSGTTTFAGGDMSPNQLIGTVLG